MAGSPAARSVRFRHPALDSPARTGRDGVVPLVFTAIGSPILLLLGGRAVSGDERTLNPVTAATSTRSTPPPID